MEDNIHTIEELNATIETLNGKIAELTEANESLKNELDTEKSMSKYYRESKNETVGERDRIKNVIDAISLMLSAIK